MLSALAVLDAHFAVTPDRRGERHVRCANCGKEPKRGQVHCSYSERGVACFVCGWRAGLAELLRRLGATAPYVAPAAPPKPARPATWAAAAEALVARYAAALDRVEAWTRYRPFTLDTIARFELGVGVLPASPCAHRRLVYPIREAGRVVALRGRRLDCACPKKTLLAGGSRVTLFNAEVLGRGRYLTICENPADAMLADQDFGMDAVALQGAANWRDAWRDAIAAAGYRHVRVWLDNDPPGRQHAAKIAASLRAAGVFALAWRWPDGSAPKADLGAFLMDARREAECA